jgi:hypothetical protein
MDLIGQLSSQLGVSSDQAQGLAGGLMGLVKGAVGPEAAGQVAAAVPEAKGWEQSPAATQALGSDPSSMLSGLLGGAAGAGGGGLGALLGSAGSLVGGQAGAAMQAAGGAAALSGLLSKFGLKAEHAAVMAPIAFSFLQSRLPPDLLSKVTAVLPMLGGGGSGAPAGEAGGGALGALTGLLK